MKTVKVEKARLLKALYENKKSHEEDFEITWDGYATRVVSNLEELLRAAKNRRVGEQINLHVNLSAPENHSEDYARAIQMLDWELEDTVELEEVEFQSFVQDDWDWTHRVRSSNTMYTGSPTPSKLTIK